MLSVNENFSLLVFGDLKARTGKELDYIIYDNVKWISGFEWYTASDFSRRRRSKDDHVNIFGRTLLNLCKELDVHIVNERCRYDCGIYIFISSQGKSLIDYVLASPSLFKYILGFSILTTDISNHFPTITKLKICTRNRRLKMPVTCKLRSQLRLVWDVNRVNDFVKLLCDDQSRTLFR